MRAIALNSPGSHPALLEDLRVPTVSSRDVLVRVRASSVNLWDVQAAARADRNGGSFPITLGHDFAGTVARRGSTVTRFSQGDEVFGFVDMSAGQQGALAEYVAVSEADCLAHMPASLDHTAAASVPMAGLAAIAAIDALEASHGTTLLLVGAHGGVGTFAVQLATARGWKVVATGLPDDARYLSRLGASAMLDCRANLAEAVRKLYPDRIDALVDLMSDRAGFLELAGLVRLGGAAVSVVGAAGDEQLDGITTLNAQVTADPSRLEELALLFDAGKLEVPVRHTFPLEDTSRAFEYFSGKHVVGKLAISID